MGRPDFSEIVYRLNLLVIALIFVILVPTVHVYRAWFPDKSDKLWMIPAALLLISAIFWVVFSMKLPEMIRKGQVKDLRKAPREGDPDGLRRFLKILLPVLAIVFQVILVLMLAILAIYYLRRGPSEDIWNNLS